MPITSTRHPLLTPGTGRAAKALTAALAGTLLVVTGCGQAPDSDDAGETSDFTGCIVADASGFNDASFNEAAMNGMRQVEEDRGIQVRSAEAAEAQDANPALTSMADSGCDLTVAMSYTMVDPLREVAAANPESHFMIVDDDSIQADNVKPVVYNTAEAAFLAGYLAAGTSETGAVGTLGGMQQPAVTVFMDGFALGVAHWNETQGADVQVVGWNESTQQGTFVNSYTDTNAAKTMTRNLMDQGADVVMPVAGQAGNGALDAVLESENAKIVWVDQDGFESLDRGKDRVLTSVMKGITTSTVDVLDQSVDGEFSPETYVGTLENGGVSIADFHDGAAPVDPQLQEQVGQLRQQIIDGELSVESRSAPSS